MKYLNSDLRNLVMIYLCVSKSMCIFPFGMDSQKTEIKR